MDEIDRLLLAYRSKGVLVDSNLLLLYFVGLLDPAKINSFKRTAMFSRADFDLLAKLLGYFRRVVTTPNILTEVSNLSNQLPEHVKDAHYSVFSKVVTSLDEHYVPSVRAVAPTHFSRFGLTDSAIQDLAQDKYLVLSDDLKLTLHLQMNGIDAINFNHIRVLNW
jgi:rRNA-processing protein FCF1